MIPSNPSSTFVPQPYPIQKQGKAPPPTVTQKSAAKPNQPVIIGGSPENVQKKAVENLKSQGDNALMEVAENKHTSKVILRLLAAIFAVIVVAGACLVGGPVVLALLAVAAAGLVGYHLLFQSSVDDKVVNVAVKIHDVMKKKEEIENSNVSNKEQLIGELNELERKLRFILEEARHTFGSTFKGEGDVYIIKQSVTVQRAKEERNAKFSR